MDEKHRQRVRGVKPTIEMTTRVLNALTRLADQVTSDPQFMVEKHEWLKDSLDGGPLLYANLAQHADAIQRTFESALSDALYGVPFEELTKRKGDAHIFDLHAPETIGELQSRLLRSVTYVSENLSHLDGLEPESQMYCMHLYSDLQEHLHAMAQEILSQPKVRGVD